MKIIGLAAAIAAILAGIGPCASQAQGMRTVTETSSPPRTSLVRVTASVQFNVTASVDDQNRQQQSLRRTIYEMASRECATLREVFEAECRLMALNVNSSTHDRGAGQERVTANGSATFELTLGAPPRP
jgi:hypothetical protein